MSWVRLDDAFPEHPKVLAAGGDAAWLYVCALAYSNRQLTDGYIPAAALTRLSDRKKPAGLAERLVAVGLWDAVPSGWVIHDFLVYQTARSRVEEERERARERMANNRARSQNVRANNGRSSEEVRLTPSTSQEEEQNNKVKTLDRRPSIATDTGFSQFWACYPRKVGKPTAQTSYRKALTKAPAEALAEGLRLWCAYWQHEGQPEFVPHPTTWLNQERWNDQPPATAHTETADERFARLFPEQINGTR